MRGSFVGGFRFELRACSDLTLCLLQILFVGQDTECDVLVQCTMCAFCVDRRANSPWAAYSFVSSARFTCMIAQFNGLRPDADSRAGLVMPSLGMKSEVYVVPDPAARESRSPILSRFPFGLGSEAA